jgi:hypothetical protein
VYSRICGAYCTGAGFGAGGLLVASVRDSVVSAIAAGKPALDVRAGFKDNFHVRLDNCTLAAASGGIRLSYSAVSGPALNTYVSRCRTPAFSVQRGSGNSLVVGCNACGQIDQVPYLATDLTVLESVLGTVNGNAAAGGGAPVFTHVASTNGFWVSSESNVSRP